VVQGSRRRGVTLLEAIFVPLALAIVVGRLGFFSRQAFPKRRMRQSGSFRELLRKRAPFTSTPPFSRF
jgi:hypothetical protein